MGGVNDRSRATKPFDSETLARLVEDARVPAPPDDEPVRRTASGTEPPQQGKAPAVPAAAPGSWPTEQSAADKVRSRANTIHDPLTTSLLAEVARRTKTIEMTPVSLDEIDEPK